MPKVRPQVTAAGLDLRPLCPRAVWSSELRGYLWTQAPETGFLPPIQSFAFLFIPDPAEPCP